MFKFRYSTKRKQYTAGLKINDLKGNPVELEIKFDTGAVSTVISVNKLFGSVLSDVDLDNIKKQLDNKGINKHEFTSASGHTMAAYPCYYQDVVLDGCKFEYFKFYMIIEKDVNIAVVGDDFISCCNFVHSMEDDIVINSFNHNSYLKEIAGEKCLDTVGFLNKE